MCKKILFTFGFLAVFGFIFNFGAPDAKALTAAELQTLIQQLQQQIAQLQQQLAQVQEEPAVWCHDFNVKLRIGDTGDEVKALQTALTKEGATAWEYKGYDGVFDEMTASEVVGFQEKYKEDVLAPWGLKNGTGYVGPTTLAKLNELYGCEEEEEEVTPSVTVTSPNGGEEWEIGKTYEIKWEARGVEKIVINVTDYSLSNYPTGLTSAIATNINATIGSYLWTIPQNFFEKWGYKSGDNFKIMVAKAEGGLSDESDDYFSIVEAAAGPALWDWDYCSADRPCSAGQGDCDSDVQCAGDLVCSRDVGANYGQVSSMDVCEEKETGEINVTSISGPTSVTANQSASYSFTATDQTGTGSLDFFIDWGDGTLGGEDCIAESAVKESREGSQTFTCTASHTFTKAGTFTLKVKASPVDVANWSSEKTLIVTVGQSSITVTSPNGGETFKVGQTVNIKWDSANLSSTETVTIDLNSKHNDPTWSAGQTFEDRIIYSTPNDGSYSWTIPEYYARGVEQNSFSVKIRTNSGYSDYSDGKFTILSAPESLTDLTVIVPVAGASYSSGETAPVDWTPKDSSEQYSVNLLRESDSSFLRLGLQKSLNEWGIPSGIPAGDDYYLRVNQGSGRAKTGYSQKFSIVEVAAAMTCADSDGGKSYYTKGTITENRSGQVYTYTDVCYPGGSVLKEYFCPPSRETFGVSEDFTCPNGCQDGACLSTPSITVTSPNGGEQFTVGKPMTIKWQNTNYRDSVVNIYLYKSTTIPGNLDYNYVARVGTLAQPNDETETWTIPSTVQPGDNYFIRVNLDVKDPETGLDMVDDSDAPFSITYSCNGDTVVKDSTSIKFCNLAGQTCESGACTGNISCSNMTTKCDSAGNWVILYCGGVNKGTYENCASQGMSCVSGECKQQTSSILENLENQVASVSDAVSQLAEKIRELLGR